MYTWVTLLVSTSVLLALRAWMGRRWLTWLGYIVVTTAALYTHYYAVFGILLENLFLALSPAAARAHSLEEPREPGPSCGNGWAPRLPCSCYICPGFPLFCSLSPWAVAGGWLWARASRRSRRWRQTVVLYMVGTGRALYPALLRRPGYLLFGATLVLGLCPSLAGCHGSGGPRPGAQRCSQTTEPG